MILETHSHYGCVFFLLSHLSLFILILQTIRLESLSANPGLKLKTTQSLGFFFSQEEFSNSERTRLRNFHQLELVTRVRFLLHPTSSILSLAVDNLEKVEEETMNQMEWKSLISKRKSVCLKYLGLTKPDFP